VEAVGPAAQFISIEGGEGVGKSSFVGNLSSALQLRKLRVVTTREPGGTLVADRIREIFVNPPASEALTAEAELCLVSAARSQHVRHFIERHLAAGDWVLCDRFTDSSLVYQSVLGGLERGFVESLLDFTTGGRKPSLTFLLDCPVDVSLKRLASRQQEKTSAAPSRYDQATQRTHTLIRDAFLQIQRQESKRVVLIDAAKSQEEMLQQAMTEIERRYGESK